MKKYSTLLFCLFFKLVFAQNDIAVGTWRSHLSYHTSKSLAFSENKVYAASDNGLFVYDKNEKSIEKIGKTEGLSDVDIAQIAFHNQTLIVAYQNGNLDLVQKDEIINIRSLLNSNFTNKQIFDIQTIDNQVVISGSFGIIILDLKKGEISESITQIGNNAQSIAVYSTAILNNRLYAATEQGLKSIELSGKNKLDYRNWTSLNTKPNVRDLAVLNGQLFVAINNEDIYKLIDNQLVRLNLPFQEIFYDLKVSQNQLVLCLDNRLIKIQENGSFESIANDFVKKPRQAFLDEKGIFWIADYQNGLVTNQDGQYKNILPSGVFSSDIWQLKYLNNKIIAVSGAYIFNQNYTTFSEIYKATDKKSGFYVFESGIWTNFNEWEGKIGSQKIPPIRDLVDVAYNPANQKYYFASFQDGILVWDTQLNNFEILDSKNSPLSNNRISGVAVDNQNTLWISVFGAEGKSSVFGLKPNGEWLPFLFRDASATYPLSLTTDDAASVWLQLSPRIEGGIFVFDKNGKQKYLGNANNLQSSSVNCLHNDRRGNIWVGTDLGIRVFYGAADILSQNNPRGELVVYDRKELLNNEKITAISSDGGNRKWIGTNNGVWLFDELKGKIIANFTEKNSPLLSNKILSIAVDGKTGEVFFGTDKGIVSYRGTSTDAKPVHENVQIFPNPVPPNFEGVVSVSGLVRNAVVKITDISGKLIFETLSQGGTATWNKRNLNGSSAKSGIYLVFSASQDGSETFIGKIALLE